MEYDRPKEGFRFHFGGVNTKEVADSLPMDQYQGAVNIRATAEGSMRTRPGYQFYFAGNNNNNNFNTAPITDMRAYTTLGNYYPRVLARDLQGRVFLDNNLQVGNLAGNAGYGVAMVPFRPKESATPWMYLADQGAYQKFSAPAANNAVTQSNVGIAEPQLQLEAGPNPPIWQYQGPVTTANWPAGGNNTSATADITRSNESVVGRLADPVVPTRQSMITSFNTAYGLGEIVGFNNNTFYALVEDYIPSIGNATVLAIQAIRYHSGNNGNCTIFLGQIPGLANSGAAVPGLRRGAVMRLNTANNGIEYALVHDVVLAANGAVAVDTSTTIDWDAITPKNIQVFNTLVVNNNNNVADTDSLVATAMTANFNAGLSTISFNVANSNTFATASGAIVRDDDYLHLSVRFSDPTQLIQMMLLFYLDSPLAFGTYSNLLYYAVRPGDLVQVPSGNTQVIPAILDAAEAELIGTLPTPGNIQAPDQTAAGANQWSEIWIPVSELQRIGSDLSKTLASCQGFQMQLNLAGACTVGWSSFWNGAGSPPDVGNNGAPYRYLAVPMNSNTGVVGNPTPVMKYGVNPRRQSVLVKTGGLNNAYDGQIDAWQVFRYGGSITSYRFLGVVPAGNNFTDTFFDDTAQAGLPVEKDNTQPWPTIDQPWQFVGGSANAYGQWLVLNGGTNFPASMNRWLPGTLFQIGSGQDTFTLRSRPVITGNNAVLEFEEVIGATVAGNRVVVLEPVIAAQPLPYVWGPDEYGFMFGAGDPYRPGNVYWCKGNTPDAAPTRSNAEVCQPSEPTLGGAVLKGVSYVASSKRWWMMNFQTRDAQQQYIPVGAPIDKRLLTPYGLDTDNERMYFWTEDGISSTGGAACDSLTDAQLWNLFPHAGVAGVNVVNNGVTWYAPDYSRAAQFRLKVVANYIYAFYLDSTGTPRTLIYDKVRKGWSQDLYAHQVRTAYYIEQPQATLSGNNLSIYPQILLGDNNGTVWQVKDLTNDGKFGGNLGTPISAMVATAEFNGGDTRTNTQFGDLFVDVVPPFGMNVTPIVQGQPIVDANNNSIVTTIAANNNRQFVPVTVGGQVLQNFLGLRIEWTDNFANASVPTRINLWQPSFVDKPETITTRFGDTVDFGQACYVRGVTIYADTFGANKSVKIRNLDNDTLYALQSVASNNNTASIINHNGEQEINYWFDPPFVAHMVRDESQDAVEWRKFKFDYIRDPWPELTDLPSPWMNIRDTGQAGFLQGLILPLEVGDANSNTAPALRLRTDNRYGSNNIVDLVPHNRPEFNVKTGIAYSLATPIVCHQVQIIPQEKCRVWWNEIAWKAERTPDLATTWKTQWTGFGQRGFKHIARVEMTYAAQAGAFLTIEVQDGTAPEVIDLPSSADSQAKVNVNLTFNKFQLCRFSAVSDGVFQIFLEDCLIWVSEWGREGPATPFKLGAQFGDGATI